MIAMFPMTLTADFIGGSPYPSSSEFGLEKIRR